MGEKSGVKKVKGRSGGVEGVKGISSAVAVIYKRGAFAGTAQKIWQVAAHCFSAACLGTN